MNQILNGLMLCYEISLLGCSLFSIQKHLKLITHFSEQQQDLQSIKKCSYLYAGKNNLERAEIWLLKSSPSYLKKKESRQIFLMNAFLQAIRENQCEKLSKKHHIQFLHKKSSQSWPDSKPKINILKDS